MKYVDVSIKKPIYDNYVGIRDKYIWQAKKYKALLRITTPHGTTIISPDKYLQGADRIEKVFLRPDQPMVLYCKNVVPTKIKEERPRVVPHIVEDHTIPFSVLERLRDRAKQLNLI